MPVHSNLTAEAGAAHPGAPVRLADFTTWPRALLISMAAVIMGAISSAVAYALLWLISVITSLAFSSAGLRCLPHRRAVMLASVASFGVDVLLMERCILTENCQDAVSTSPANTALILSSLPAFRTSWITTSPPSQRI